MGSARPTFAASEYQKVPDLAEDAVLEAALDYELVLLQLHQHEANRSNLENFSN